MHYIYAHLKDYHVQKNMRYNTVYELLIKSSNSTFQFYPVKETIFIHKDITQN